MESIASFFGNMTAAKKLALSSSPFLSLLFGLREAVLALFALVFLDLVTGIRKSHHERGMRWRPLRRAFWFGEGGVKSYLLRQTWRKLYEYVLGILAISLAEAHLLSGLEESFVGASGGLARLAVTVAGLVELWSIFENMEAVGGRNFLKRLAGLLPERLRGMLGGGKTG